MLVWEGGLFNCVKIFQMACVEAVQNVSLNNDSIRFYVITGDLAIFLFTSGNLTYHKTFHAYIHPVIKCRLPTSLYIVSVLFYHSKQYDVPILDLVWRRKMTRGRKSHAFLSFSLFDTNVLLKLTVL